MSTCNHNPYWTGYYGTCMACRAEKAEAEVAEQQAEIKRLEAELAEWHQAFEAYHALGLAADYAQLKHLYDAQKGGGG